MAAIPLLFSEALNVSITTISDIFESNIFGACCVQHIFPLLLVRAPRASALSFVDAVGL